MQVKRGSNLFALLCHEETDCVKSTPILSDDLKYGNPSVTDQIVAKPLKDVLVAVSLLTEMLHSHIGIHHTSDKFLNTYKLAKSMSTQHKYYI